MVFERNSEPVCHALFDLCGKQLLINSPVVLQSLDNGTEIDTEAEKLRLNQKTPSEKTIL